jgi:hypothetical protein
LGDFVWIDYIIIQPLVERKIFIGPDGSELKIERRLITEVDGRDSLDEVDDLEFDIFPNPFNKETNVLLKRDGIFTVKIFDINGRKIYDTITKTGLLRLNFDDSSSGLYFCLINDGKFSKVRKLMLLK